MRKGGNYLPRDIHPSFILTDKLPYPLGILLYQILDISPLHTFRTISRTGHPVIYLPLRVILIPFRAIMLIFGRRSTSKIKCVCLRWKIRSTEILEKGARDPPEEPSCTRSCITDRMGARPVPGPMHKTGVLVSGGSFINPFCKPIRKESPRRV
jgi:hypothetical protein